MSGDSLGLTELAQTRCFNHSDREAAARCPGCQRFFCRECVTEHQGQVKCAFCLRESLSSTGQRTRFAGVLSRFVASVIGLLFAGLCFYYLGRLLMLLPDTFHEGSLWNN